MSTDHILLNNYVQRFTQLVKSEMDSLRCFDNPPHIRVKKVEALEEVRDLIEDEITRYYSLMKKKHIYHAN